MDVVPRLLVDIRHFVRPRSDDGTVRLVQFLDGKRKVPFQDMIHLHKSSCSPCLWTGEFGQGMERDVVDGKDQKFICREDRYDLLLGG